MLNSDIRILNLDGSLTRQTRLLSQYKPEIINLLDLGPRARLWVGGKIKSELEARIQKSTGLNKISFLGSGDFHHISNILIKELDTDLSVIVFDFHPDWDILPPKLGCGSWVSASLENKKILKFILLGVSSEDISTMRLQSANLASLENERLEIYPYAHAESRVFLRNVPRNLSIRTKKIPLGSKIFWSELKDKSPASFMLSVIRRLPLKKVYLSIDKDCLKNKYAVTNWEEGKMALDELLLMLKVIKENSDIAGVDITGDYSPVVIKGAFKKFCSRCDHPKEADFKGLPPDEINSINEETNLRILDVLKS